MSMSKRSAKRRAKLNKRVQKSKNRRLLKKQNLVEQKVWRVDDVPRSGS